MISKLVLNIHKIVSLINTAISHTNIANKKRRDKFFITSPLKETFLFIKKLFLFYFKNASKIPAATALPITPDTFGPIACINK